MVRKRDLSAIIESHAPKLSDRVVAATMVVAGSWGHAMTVHAANASGAHDDGRGRGIHTLRSRCGIRSVGPCDRGGKIEDKVADAANWSDVPDFMRCKRCDRIVP